MKKYFYEYKKNILNHNFYQAHEILEEIWFPKRKEKDNFTLTLKGFINAAVSFELYKRGKKESSSKVWKNYLKLIKNLDKLNNQKLKRELKSLKEFINKFKKSYIK